MQMHLHSSQDRCPLLRRRHSNGYPRRDLHDGRTEHRPLCSDLNLSTSQPIILFLLLIPVPSAAQSTHPIAILIIIRHRRIRVPQNLTQGPLAPPVGVMPTSPSIRRHGHLARRSRRRSRRPTFSRTSIRAGTLPPRQRAKALQPCLKRRRLRGHRHCCSWYGAVVSFWRRRGGRVATTASRRADAA